MTRYGKSKDSARTQRVRQSGYDGESKTFYCIEEIHSSGVVRLSWDFVRPQFMRAGVLEDSDQPLEMKNSIYLVC